LKTGKIWGVPIEISKWWLLGFFWTLSIIRTSLMGESGSPALIWLTAMVITFILWIVVVLHELAHAWTALKCKRDVRKIKLLDFGGITFTKSKDEGSNLRHDLLISGIAPLSTLMLAGLIFAAKNFFMLTPFLEYALDWLFLTILILGLLNALPVLPLDGGKCCKIILQSKFRDERKAAKYTAWIGGAICIIGPILLLLCVMMRLEFANFNTPTLIPLVLLWLPIFGIGIALAVLNYKGYQGALMLMVAKKATVGDFLDWQKHFPELSPKSTTRRSQPAIICQTSDLLVEVLDKMEIDTFFTFIRKKTRFTVLSSLKTTQEFTHGELDRFLKTKSKEI